MRPGRRLAITGTAIALAVLAGAMPAAAQAQAGGSFAPEAEAAPPSDSAMTEGLFVSTVRRRAATPSAQAIAACKEQKAAGDIVVCGANRGEQWRVPSTTDSDPTAREAQDTGIARAPDVSSLPGCARGCLGFGKGPPKVLTIDLSSLPKAPKGSDADRIARGEMADR